MGRPPRCNRAARGKRSRNPARGRGYVPGRYTCTAAALGPPDRDRTVGVNCRMGMGRGGAVQCTARAGAATTTTTMGEWIVPVSSSDRFVRGTG
uniref:Uncharacterized protein n=1 Tax=Oryza sativa subsp. japonica TaxID=39947 RepID=Q67WF5_ORYSJ|nr:hypothetical protein [Oryza sativa Japonica Group]